MQIHSYIKIRSSVIVPEALLAFLSLLLSCTGNEPVLPGVPDGNGMCKATIRLDVSAFDQTGEAGTRSSVAGNNDENTIDNIWVFQYNALTGESLHVPVYLENFDSNDIDVDLALNENGENSLVCIVANIGEYGDGGEDTDTGAGLVSKEGKWALDENENTREGFNTYGELLQQVIPKAASQPFISSHMGDNGGKFIPMFGTSKSLAIVSKCYVSIPLVRMFARVEVSVDPSYLSDMGMEIGNIAFRSIPEYCRVKTLASEEGNGDAAEYPADTEWTEFDAHNANDVILYVPENLQGKVASMTSKLEAAEEAPGKALKVELKMLYDEGSKEYTYTVYPGLDMTNDFNIKRNHIYNVNVKITKLPE